MRSTGVKKSCKTPRSVILTHSFLPSQPFFVRKWKRNERKHMHSMLIFTSNECPCPVAHTNKVVLCLILTMSDNSEDPEVELYEEVVGEVYWHRVTNMEVLSRTGQRRLQHIVAERRLRMAGHMIRMPSGRPANHAMSWTLRGSGRRPGRPTKTWRSTFKEDLVDRGVDWNSVRTVATNRSRWWTLAAHCPVKDWRI